MRGALTALTIVAVLGLTACGVSVDTGSGDGTTEAATTETEAPTTSAAEVQQLVRAFREMEARADESAAERDECGEVTPIKEYREACAEPWAEKDSVSEAETEALVNELKSEVGEGCREALESEGQYGKYGPPIDTKKIGACSRDVGR